MTTFDPNNPLPVLASDAANLLLTVIHLNNICINNNERDAAEFFGFYVSEVKTLCTQVNWVVGSNNPHFHHIPAKRADIYHATRHIFESAFVDMVRTRYPTYFHDVSQQVKDEHHSLMFNNYRNMYDVINQYDNLRYKLTSFP